MEDPIIQKVITIGNLRKGWYDGENGEPGKKMFYYT